VKRINTRRHFLAATGIKFMYKPLKKYTMKTTIRNYQLATVVLFIFLLPGCKKAYDYLKDHKNGVTDCCRVESIDFKVDEQNIRAIFSYDKNDNPLSITYEENINNAALVHSFFKYDNRGRLTGRLQNYQEPPGFLIWDKYVYTDNKHVIDSTFLYGTGGWPGDRPTKYSYLRTSLIELDKLDRIVKTTEYFNVGEPFVTTYSYDARGNLVSVSSSNSAAFNTPGYDNELNIHHTNKVWMFVDKDYSINNPLNSVGNSYNNFHLPLELTHDIYTTTFMNVSYDSATVNYSCRDNNFK